METENNYDFTTTQEQLAEIMERVHKNLSERKNNEEPLVSDERFEELKERMRELLKK